MVFVAMMLEMRLTLILNISTNLLHQIDSFESLFFVHTHYDYDVYV